MSDIGRLRKIFGPEGEEVIQDVQLKSGPYLVFTKKYLISAKIYGD